MDELGEATYAMRIKAARRSPPTRASIFRVVDVVVLDEEDGSPFVGMLMV